MTHADLHKIVAIDNDVNYIEVPVKFKSGKKVKVGSIESLNSSGHFKIRGGDPQHAFRGRIFHSVEKVPYTKVIGINKASLRKRMKQVFG
jgi:hypothetical protein